MIQLREAPAVWIYARRSRSDALQVASIDRQIAEITSVIGPVDPEWIFVDEQSGWDWERPGFERMKMCAEQFPRDRKTDAGTIVVWEKSRFGRAVNENLTEVDLEEYNIQVHDFLKLGYRLRSIREPSTGNKLVDGMLDMVQNMEGGQKPIVISEGARSGLARIRAEGYWASNAPYPCVRVDAETGKVIQPGERNPQRKCILQLDPELYVWWERMAHKLLAGASLVEIARWLDEQGAEPPGVILGRYQVTAKRPKPRKPRWFSSNVRVILTNRVLIGEIVHTITGNKKARKILATPVVTQAKWGVLVNRELWDAVQAEFRARGEKAPRRRSIKGEFLLDDVRCTCGMKYTAQTHKYAKRSTRYYRHRSPLETVPALQRERTLAQGCGHACIRADVLEEQVRQLIVQERGSPAFVAHLQQLLDEREGRESVSANAVLRLRTKRMQLDETLKNTVRAHINAVAAGRDETPYLAVLQETEDAIARVQEQIAAAERAHASLSKSWERIDRICQDTRVIAESWDHATTEEKKRLFKYWVEGIVIADKGDERVAMVQLSVNPDPQFIALRKAAEPLSAQVTSWEDTHVDTGFEADIFPVSVTRAA